MQVDFILDIFRYFARFPSLTAVDRLFTTSSGHAPGYAELRADMATLPQYFPEISTFIFSINRKLVADSVKNSKGVMMFVEYERINVNYTHRNFEISNKIALTVATEWSINNRTPADEILVSNQMLNLLTSIIKQMQDDMENDNEFCQLLKLITFPTQLYPVDPKDFEDRLGWLAMFEQKR